MFIINFNFIKSIEEVNTITEAHREYVSKQYENDIFIIGGPKKPRDGGIVLAHSCSEKELRTILDNDPLILNEFAHYSLTEFTPLMATKKIDSYINQLG
ncbi:YciI family protein [Aquimarina aquimarini]|uniref:YciI family protein n=1 Tax=Aquimarina aquimarini TaxID=1191734 RepID=UPI000D557018|nr:YciI family protein [Aquimarina aquimarini]